MASQSGSESPRPTLASIAAEAGVSAATVSKVLNGHSDVAAKTRAGVQALLAAHNYEKRPRPRSAGLIDVLFTQLRSPWAVEIIRGAEEAARPVGCAIAVFALENGKAGGRDWLDTVLARRP